MQMSVRLTLPLSGDDEGPVPVQFSCIEKDAYTTFMLFSEIDRQPSPKEA